MHGLAQIMAGRAQEAVLVLQGLFGLFLGLAKTLREPQAFFLEPHLLQEEPVGRERMHQDCQREE